MENMKWNKLTTRPLDDEEKEYYKNSKIDFMWDGYTPEIDEEVLVWTPRSDGVYTDIWIDFDDGIGFENILFAFDDDDKVNEMYKKHGVMCYKPNITNVV